VPTEIVLQFATRLGHRSRRPAHIFEPFLHDKEAGTTGLGLAIARGVVERHKGRIEVESELGRGTTFNVTLPTHSPDPELAGVGIQQ